MNERGRRVRETEEERDREDILQGQESQVGAKLPSSKEKSPEEEKKIKYLIF